MLSQFSYSALSVQCIDRILEVRLNRPHRHNAFHPVMIGELRDFAQKLNAESEVRVVVLRGEGVSFCAGGDMEWMRSMAGFSMEENLSDARELFDMFMELSAVEIPMFAVAQGNIMGGGLGLLAVCDWVVAESKARLSFSEVRIGLIPAVISPFVRRKGNRSALQELMVDARVFSASEAQQAGLVNFVADSDQLQSALDARIRETMVCAPGAVRETKRLLWQLDRPQFESWREICARAISNRRASAEGQEGLSAFLDKREPRWRGSK